ncbi:S-adenosyl-L-methionine-dependent methyltransferase [Aspergillus bertholletiae]|uniref:S-adenosyl-L-methionine-dependent methyltransferase n=1 Tax=Aspergillus bertholletiae TaxID=1226010 RepID=A0A5N7B3I6_9EURO|nr:S-adenosyl-L-methionine-dependent methyltransferase [Aspergillus bertholletiae]
MAGSTDYVHGYQPSVLRSHSWRTASNSAAYLLPHITPAMHILDVGCGPGTITMDLANYVPQGKVVGLEHMSGHEVLQQATSTAKEKGLQNVEFTTGDAHALPFDNNTFDITHAHQVLQHVSDPVRVLQEMCRVTKPDGYIAVRSTDFRGFAWWPESDGLTKWRELYLRVMRNNGGTPDSGRRLHLWARQAGLQCEQITQTVGTWCFATKAEVAWWSSLWAERLLESKFRESALKDGIVTDRELESASQAWKDWGSSEDAWFLAWHGELLYHK